MRFGNLDFIVTMEEELAQVPATIQPLYSASLDAITEALEELQLHTPEAHAEARCKVWNPGGEPFCFIGVMDARKPTAHLDLRACHDLPQHPTTGRVHAISIHSLRKHAGHFASLGRP